MPITFAPGYDASDPYGLKVVNSALAQMEQAKAQRLQQQYMQSLMAQREREARDASAKAYAEQQGNAATAAQLYAARAYMGMPVQQPLQDATGGADINLNSPGAPVGGGGASYNIPTYSQSAGGQMTPTGSVSGVDPGGGGKPRTPAQRAPAPEPYMRDAMSPLDMQRFEEWVKSYEAAQESGDERALRSVEAAGGQMYGSLNDNFERAAQGRSILASKAALAGLPPEERKVQEDYIDAIAGMVKAGIPAQSLSGVFERLHPNVRDRLENDKLRQEISSTADQSEADALATPALLQQLAKEDPAFAGLAAVPGLHIWGAASKFLEKGVNDSNTRGFDRNSANAAARERDNINLRASTQRPDFDPIGLLISSAAFQAGAKAGQGEPPTRSIDVIFDDLLTKMATAAPNIYTPQIVAQARGQKPVIGDVMFYQQRGITPEEFPEAHRLMLQSGRSKEHADEVLRLLRDANVRSGPARQVGPLVTPSR